MITSKDVKLINKNRIYRYIYEKKQTSRQEIFEEIGLSMPTIHQNLKVLVEDGLVVIDGNFESTGGRKAQIFSINSRARYAVALNIMPDRTYARVIDMYGAVVNESYTDMKFKAEDTCYARCAELIDNCIEAAGIMCDKILGVGITIPGILDDTNTIVLNAPVMGMKNCSVSDIASHIKYPWIVMNDAKSGCYSWYWFNMRGRNNSGFIYLMLSQGVGGAMIDGKFDLSDTHNRSGEFGHMTIHPSGKKCFCGRNGCFESYVSSRCLSDNYGITLDEFFGELEGGSDERKKIFDEYLENLAIGVNNLYTICGCNIVIGGQAADYLQKYEDELKQKLVIRYSFDTDAGYIRFSDCTEARASAGAALTYISKFIETI